MRSLFLITTLLALGDPGVVLTTTTTGVNQAFISETPVSSVVDMEAASKITNQLALTLAVAAGSTTTFTFTCAESETGIDGSFAAITVCATGGSCAPDSRTYTMANYTASSDGRKRIASRWAPKQRYVQCTAAGSGTGKLTITGTRSWQ